jgi:hypothetical protein
MYERLVREWVHLIPLATDLRCDVSVQVAPTCQTVVDGMIAHAHLCRFANACDTYDYNVLAAHLERTLPGYLR